MIVVDASVLGPALADDGPSGEAARARLAGEPLAAPELIDLEVASLLRRAIRAGRLDLVAGASALDDLTMLPISRTPHAPLLPRIWELRDNLTAYDAAYVALAEMIEAPLVTADRRLERASPSGCVVELLPGARDGD